MKRVSLVVLAATLGLSACVGGGDEEGDTTAGWDEAGPAAKAFLDETSGVELALSTEDAPASGDFLSSAEGVITRQPAFSGMIAGRVMGFEASDIPVIAVDGDVWVKAPVIGWDSYDPSTFCAPDPALLLEPDSGVSSVLIAAEDVEAGETERSTEDATVTVTPYSGTVPGEAIQNILPCAEGDAFDATFRVDGDGRLLSADITGEFFPDSDAITYTIDIREYDVERDITAPE